jgi:hypothetical protein
LAEIKKNNYRKVAQNGSLSLSGAGCQWLVFWSQHATFLSRWPRNSRLNKALIFQAGLWIVPFDLSQNMPAKIFLLT